MIKAKIPPPALGPGLPKEPWEVIIEEATWEQFQAADKNFEFRCKDNHLCDEWYVAKWEFIDPEEVK